MIWAYAVQSASLPVADLVTDLTEVRAVLVDGPLEHLVVPRMQVQVADSDTAEGIQISLAPTTAASVQILDPAVRLLLLTPVDLTNPRHEADARSQLGAAAGLIAALEGRSLLLTKLFESTVSIADDGIARHRGSTPSFHAPHVRQPDLSDNRMRDLVSLAQAIDNLPLNDAQRIRLSLEWFESAFDLSDRDSVEVVLRLWIALEALAMPGSTNIGPINQYLAAAYGLTTAEATTRFLVGKLYGLRSRIVHDGSRPTINATVLLHMQAVYIDVLFQVLGRPCERRSEASINGADVAADLRAALSV